MPHPASGRLGRGFPSEGLISGVALSFYLEQDCGYLGLVPSALRHRAYPPCAGRVHRPSTIERLGSSSLMRP